MRKSRIGQRILSFLLTLVMVVGLCFVGLPAYESYADEPVSSAMVKLSIGFREGNADLGKVQYSIDAGTSWMDVTKDVSELEITLADSELRLKIVPNENYSVDYAGVELSIGEERKSGSDLSSIGLDSEEGYTVPSGIENVSLSQIEFREGGKEPDDGEETDIPDGMAAAIINLSGPEGSWALSPAVDEPYDIKNEDGSASAPYSKYAYVAGISINGSDRTNRMMHYNKDEDTRNLESQIVVFKKDSEDSVTFTFNTSWSDRIEEVKVNGTVYSISLDYDDRYSWLTAFGNQDIRFDISGIVLPTPDSEGRYVFDVELKVRPITWDECFIGNFLWSKDEHFSPEGPDPSDIYIGHSSLILESVDFNNGREDIHWQIDVEDDGTDKEYKYEENGESYDYAHFSMKYPENDCSMGEMVIPEGAEVTMKIVPEYGYQVKSFSGVDFEEGNVKLQGGQCEFTFVVGRGNFHIGAKVEEQEDDLISSSDAVVGGGVLLPEGIIDSGTARLDVSDAELSEAKISDFNDVAEREGLEIGAFLELDLKQVFFKGMDDDMEVWENPIELDELKDDDSILVGLQLPEDAEIPDDLTIIHNIDNGEEFEMIEPVSIENNMVIFETKGFSSYALAFSVEDTEDSSTEDVTEDGSSEEVTSEEGASEEAAKDADIEEASEDKTDAASEAADNSPKTGDGSETGLMMIILLLSAGIMCVLAQRKRNNVRTAEKKER